MNISDPTFINLLHLETMHKDLSSQLNTQDELKCFETLLINELLNSAKQDPQPPMNTVFKPNSYAASFFSHLLQSLDPNDNNTATSNTSQSNKYQVTQLYAHNQMQYQKNSTLDYNKVFNGDVFLGDSITQGLLTYNFLDNSKVYSEVGIGVDKVINKVESAALTNPQRVFVLCGVNDLGRFSKEQFGQHYKRLIDTIKTKCPNAKIYLQPILPVLSKASEINPNVNNQRIDEFNSVIYRLSKTENVGYINSSNLFNNNLNYYANDGIHLKPSFYPNWLNNLQRSALLNPY